jgi:hypothetical protein
VGLYGICTESPTQAEVAPNHGDDSIPRRNRTRDPQGHGHTMQVRAGQGAPPMAVKLNARAEGVTDQDFPDGVEYAAGQGWLTYSDNWLGLTDAGFAAA